MFEPVFFIAGVPVSPAILVAAAGIVLFFLMAAVLILTARRGREDSAREGQALAAQLAEMTGRMQAMAENLSTRQSELSRTVNERLDTVSQRLGQSMTDTQKNTQEHLQKLNERLAVIDKAQHNITQLSSEVVQLQSILSNKQTRGAFGQGQMEAIVKDRLPKDAYSFQFKLSNGRMPDCVIHMPEGAGDIVIDAKFPLEAYNALKAADDEHARKQAEAAFRQHVQKHIADIAERYFIPGETGETAFMFVPSESVFAEIRETFDDLVQRAYRARIVIVSPSLLMLSVQTIQAVMRDVQMREQAHLIQKEVAYLMDDMGRLGQRVQNLQSHFQQANKDVEQILISTDKVTKRGARIEALELDEKSGEARPKLAASGGERA